MATLVGLKEKFNKAVDHIERDGIDNLMHWLETDTDFFSAPASINFHGNYQGGLVQHSILVLEFALTNFNWILKYKPDYISMKESIIISALFHDICKINQYYWGEEKWIKKEGKWHSYKGYKFDDKLPIGHGEKSIYYISKFIKLTTSELLAIRWHMGPYEIGTQINGLTKYAYNQAAEDTLVKIIHSADILAITLEETINYANLVK